MDGNTDNIWMLSVEKLTNNSETWRKNY